jgi:hypothetical protein
MTKIRAEIRAENASGEDEPEIWVNLGDVLRWLDDVPRNLDAPIAATVVEEVRRMLYEDVSTGLDESAS